MGRPQRHDTAGTFFHLMNRGADRQDIFSSNSDRHMFEYQLGDLVQRGLIEIYAYALMDNHFHLLVRSLIGELSAAMHRLGSEYARWYNREHRRDGPLFRNRFVSVSVDTDEQFMVTARYIHRNPKAMVPIPALGVYRWSSLGAHLGTREAPPWLEVELLEQLMGGTAEHRRFVEQAHRSDDDELWMPFRDGVDLSDLEAAVAAVTGRVVKPTDRVGRRQSDAFILLLVLALEFRCESSGQISQRYDLASASAVRAGARRGRVRLVDDPEFARLRSRVLDVLAGPRAA
jgi:REP element-mobilizing transposase RayT